MRGRQRTIHWPKVAGGVGIVLAIIVTAVIWFQVIDRQATAMLRGEGVVLGTPIATEPVAGYRVAGERDEPSPIP